MKKRWIVISAAVLICLVIFILSLRSNNIDQELKSAPETALASERHSTRWYYKSPLKRRRGIALVVHGLNLKPEKMESIIHQLNRAGIDALNVSLHGHGDNYARHGRGRGNQKEARLDSFRTVTYGLWSSEVHRAYLKVQDRGHRKNVPISLVGYSLGGLLGCDLLVSDAGIHFDRMVLFAPALNIMSEPYLLKALMPFPNLVIDSLSPESYRSNDGTPMAGYKALFAALDHFQERINTALNVPTIVFMDPDDEFISYDKLQEMVNKSSFDRWKVITVRKAQPELSPCAHHLLIDEEVTGKEVWAQVEGSLLAHLLPGERRERTPHPTVKPYRDAPLP
jgi:alpha-beta hydrolase superfamily lysophospholipase